MFARMQNFDDVNTEVSVNDTSSVLHESPSAPQDTPEKQNQDKKHSLASLLITVGAILAIALGIRFFIVAPYLVEGASMEETFHTFDYLMVDRITYKLEDPKRGDVVVLKFPLDTSRSFIKRIIGLPGETVVMSGESVTIKNTENPDGFTINEPYIDERHASETEMTKELKENEYFVLGDNRAESADSRFWGTLPGEDIIGRPLVQLWPLNLIRLFPGEARYEEAATDNKN